MDKVQRERVRKTSDLKMRLLVDSVRSTENPKESETVSSSANHPTLKDIHEELITLLDELESIEGD